MGRLAGRVAVVSGAARGQGRSHAVALAREGADVVAFDVCEPLIHPSYPGATWEDLEQTRRLVEAEGRSCLTAKVDARDLAGLRRLAEEARDRFEHIDVLVINHGIWVVAPNSWDLEESSWQESIDVLLTGAWKVAAAFIPTILETGGGGSIVITCSAMGSSAQPGSVAYTSAKHGVLGLMRTLAWELGPHRVRVNAVSPGSVATTMTQAGDTVERSTQHHPRFFATDRSLLPDVGWMPPEAVSKAVVYLASPDSENVTGVDLKVDAGWSTF